MLAAVLLLLSVLAASFQGVTSLKTEIYGNGKYILTYQLNQELSKVEFTISAQGKWVGLGFKNSGRFHSGGDCFIGKVNDDGQVVYYDGKAPTEDTPIQDASQDFELVSGSRENEVTTLTFTRSIITGDSNDVTFQNFTQKVYWSYSDSDSFSDQHLDYGDAFLNLLEYDPIPVTSTPTTSAPTVGPTTGEPTSPTGSKSPTTLQPTSTPVGPAPTLKHLGDINSFNHSGEARVSDSFILQWRISDDTIDFKVDVGCTGWIGVGFSTGSKFHANSDSFVGYVDGNGIAFSRDGMSSSSQARPRDDASNDYVIVDSSETNGRTMLTFSRKLNTGDANDMALVAGDQHIAYAYHRDSDSVTREHTTHGAFVVNLFDSSSVVKNSLLDEIYQFADVGVILVIIVGSLLVLLPFALRAFKDEDKIQSSPSRLKKRVKWSEIQWRDAANIALIGVLGLILALAWQDSDVADSFGLVACAYAFMTVIPATRNSVLTVLVEIPFERTIVYHRWIGRFTFLSSATHGIIHGVRWINEGVLIENLFYTQKYLFGFISLMSLTVMYFTSIEYIRRHYYQFFRWIHYLFISFFVFGVLHTTEFLKYAIAAAVFYVLDLSLRYRFGTLTSTSAQVSVLSDNAVRIRFEKNAHRSYSAGQYVFLNFPQVNARQWHPYSLTSGPCEAFLEVHVKALGNHTTRLLTKAGETPIMLEEGLDPISSRISKVKVDGPYGRLGNSYLKHSCVVLVAGGIGITPLVSVVKDVYRIGLSETQRSKYPAPRKIETVVVLWTISSISQYSWFQSVLEEANSVAESKDYPRLVVRLFVTKSTEGSLVEIEDEFQKPKGFSVCYGRPDIPVTMSELEQKYIRRKKAAVFACGPKKLVNSTWDFCTKKKNPVAYDFHHEIFNF